MRSGKTSPKLKRLASIHSKARLSDERLAVSKTRHFVDWATNQNPDFTKIIAKTHC